jgi:error-prone DNA polymerase
VPLDVAERTFESLAGFAQFGFPKSHAAAFGLLAYQTTWLKEHFPAEFFCALFNNWPMGFYPPHVFTNDARRHGVEVLRPEINASRVACTVASTEGLGTVRLGLRFVRGMGAATAAAIVDERDRAGLYRSLRDFAQRTGLAGEAIENAIRVGAFDGFGLRRRELLWQLWLLGLGSGAPTPRATPDGAPTRPRYRQLRLDLPTEQDHVPLAETTGFRSMVDDYEVLGLSPEAHPMQFLRADLPGRVRSTRELLDVPPGRTVDTAGLVVCRQRPGSGQGAVFLLLEDEHGLANVMIAPQLYDRWRTVVRGSSFLRVRGVVEDRYGGAVAMLRARTLTPVKPRAALRTPDGKSWG